MNTTLDRTIAPLVPESPVVLDAGEMRELVRGEDRSLLERLIPVVRQTSVQLDLAHVDRIDAAGIAALISLYGFARDAGHSFSILNASARVAEILTLVGLDKILLSHNVMVLSHCGSVSQRSAA